MSMEDIVLNTRKAENSRKAMEMLHMVFMENVYKTCTTRCLKKNYYNASYPSKREKVCLSDCFTNGIHSNMIFALNSTKMTKEMTEHIKEEYKKEQQERFG